MKKFDRVGFWDSVNGKKVEYYQDMYGDLYMSQGYGLFLPFSFRVKAEK